VESGAKEKTADAVLLKNYYKRKCFGRSALARALDLVLLGAILYLLFYLLCFSHPMRRWLAPLFALLAAGSFYCFAQIRLARFTQRERARIQTRIRRDMLLLMPEPELREMLGVGEIYLLQQERPVTVDDLLPILRKTTSGAKLFATTTVSEETERFLARNPRTLSVFDASAILGRIALPPVTPRQEAQYIASLSKKRTLHNYLRKTGIFDGGWKKYAYIGALLLALSFFLKPLIYYRLLSSFCFTLSGIGIFASYKNTSTMNRN